MNPQKNVTDLTNAELQSLKDTLKMLGRKDMLKEVEKELKRRNDNGINR